MTSLEHILEGESSEAAQRLLGCLLVRQLEGAQLIGRIVETEAYDETDAASHSYHGKTPRTAVMFGPSGYLYVYFTYGMHYCCNIVTGPEGIGSAVLIRAIEPLKGNEVMSVNRRGVQGVDLTNGPAKVCQALRIDKVLNGHDLNQVPLQLVEYPAIPTRDITQTTRIGINRAKDRLWRFYITDSISVSRAH